MPVVKKENELALYPLSGFVLISIFDTKTQKIISRDGDFPFIFAINKSGDTPVNRFISDVKTRYGVNKFGILSHNQIVLFFETTKENKFYFRSDEPKSYVFTKDSVDANIVRSMDTNNIPISNPPKTSIKNVQNGNVRYKGNAIGNAQNLFIRNILSDLGIESFSKSDWAETLGYFDHKCAYCGESKNLIKEHAVPINKSKLGEHKLGNLVPSCKGCNDKKHHSSYEDFLENNPEKIKKIKEYMKIKKYQPLMEHKDFHAIKEILSLAHGEIGLLAERYITILNKLNP